MYDALSEEEKALFPDHKLAALRGAEEKYAELTKGLAAWAVVLIVIGSLLVACGAFLLVIFLCFPKFVVDHYNHRVVRAIYVKKHHNIVLLLRSNLRFTEVHEADVYKTIEEAERGLKK